MRSPKSLQDAGYRAGSAAAASYTLIGAILVLGGGGYALDRWLGTSPWCLLGGLALGLAVGFYELIKSTRASMNEEPSEDAEDAEDDD